MLKCMLFMLNISEIGVSHTNAVFILMSCFSPNIHTYTDAQTSIIEIDGAY